MKNALNLTRALRLLWTSARGWTLANLALVVVQGALPLAALYLMKRIVDEVAAGIAAPDKTGALAAITLSIALAAGVALLGALFRSLADMAAEAQSLVVTDAVADVLHAQAIAVDLQYYEDARYYDVLHRAQQEAPYRPTHILTGVVQIAQNGIALLGIAGLLLAFNGWLALVLACAAVPGALVRLVYARRLYALERKQTEGERLAWYYHWMLSEASHAKEIRLFGLGDLFRTRFRDMRLRLRTGRMALSRRRALSDFVVQALAALAVFVTFGAAALEAVRGRLSLGDVVMLYQGFQVGLGALRAVLTGFAGLYEDNLFLTSLYEFLDLPAALPVARKPQPVGRTPAAGVRFEHVRFAYPSTGEPVLEDVDLTLAPGEVIALVGANGSGKTTLIKLLCRLYDPAAGRISYDGVDLREFDPAAWRRQIAVVFQDYVHYQMTAGENIWLGDVAQPYDVADAARAAQLAGADAFVSRLPAGYDTLLGNWFARGHELSVGQWQKIALARAFLRESPIVVLDEPTSSLDAEAEAELFARFRELLQGRSAILISHRFSTVQMADRIYVLDDGRVAECGTHAELLALGGKYARLYLMQAEHYRDRQPA